MGVDGEESESLLSGARMSVEMRGGGGGLRGRERGDWKARGGWGRGLNCLQDAGWVGMRREGREGGRVGGEEGGARVG